MSNNNNDLVNSIDSAINKYIDKTPLCKDPQKPLFEKKTYFYDQFRPIDQIIVKPLVESSHILMRRLYYKSEIIGFVALVCFIISIYFLSIKKENLSSLFIFFACFISFFDTLHNGKLNNKQKHKEMLIVLIKLTVFIIINMIIKLYMFSDYPCKIIKRNLYMLILILVLILMLIHHTEQIYKKNKIVSKKLLYIKRINILIFVFTCIFIILFSYNFLVDDISNNPLNIFILKNDDNDDNN